ncbi:MAG: DUF72 domain-containing protein [Caldilineaceae bacterium]|nr:DUF72 domain-containing protein [Caldilineaceae bacterium]
MTYYATQFNSVEVNTSFYGLPAPSTVLQWVESVPEGFTFALKAPRLITHEKKLIDCRQDMQAYLDVLRSLGDLAAPGFLQFPPQFTRAQYGRVLADFLDWLAGELKGLSLAVEVRARDLMTDAFARFLAERSMSLVVVERVDTTDLYETWSAQLALASTPRYFFLRLIGNDRDKLPNDRDLQRPQDETLDRWAIRIADLLAQNIEVFAYIHNPFEGHSPASVRRLWERIDRRHPLPIWSPSPPSQDDSAGQLSLL